MYIVLVVVYWTYPKLLHYLHEGQLHALVGNQVDIELSVDIVLIFLPCLQQGTHSL